MKSLDLNAPIERHSSRLWAAVSPDTRTAFFVIIIVSLLAFGFEMTNLSLHHDDVHQLFKQDTTLGHHLGRFGNGWIYYYTQGAHFMPFLQMGQAIVLMAAYGLVAGRLWGLQKPVDLAIVALVMCVFPYMAQIYQYNSAMVTYPIAHLLAALGAAWSIRRTIGHLVAASLAYFVALSIYQSVIANAAVILVIWLVAQIVQANREDASSRVALLRASGWALAAPLAGGLLYVLAVSQIGYEARTYQHVDEAFSFEHALQPRLVVPAIIAGSKAFFLYPENYFPEFLKKLQLLLIAGGALAATLLSSGAKNKIVACLLIAAAVLSPRLLQFIHPTGQFHNLTLTAYAALVAGLIGILLKSRSNPVRSISILLCGALIWGFTVQCNWISTVGYLNHQAHFSLTNRILARLDALPADGWDGRSVAVFGRYAMPAKYPFLKATGIAPDFVDSDHMYFLARILRDETSFIETGSAPAAAKEYALLHKPWPHPDSVGIAGGVAVVILSSPAGKETPGTSQPACSMTAGDC